MVTYEIYRNKADQIVSVEPPADGVSGVFVRSDLYDDRTPANTPSVDPLIDVVIPFKHTQEDGKIRVELDFTDGLDGEFTVIREIDVVTPLFTAVDFSEGDFDQMIGVTPENLKDLERFIRHIIEAYTGQSFGYSRRKYKVENVHRGVTFDTPLVKFEGISDLYAKGAMTTTNSVPYEIVDDGFGVVFDWDNFHAKTDTFFLTSKRQGGAYEIEGYFGYQSVPQDVREAAKILIGLFNCDQTLWRDRYIENLRNADGSTIRYNEGAYWGTGSVTADQLLSKYVRSEFGAAII